MQVFNVHIEKIRQAILFLRSSNSRIANFREFCRSVNKKPRKFATDTVNRWNTTYLMLASCDGYENTISNYIRNLRLDLAVTDDD